VLSRVESPLSPLGGSQPPRFHGEATRPSIDTASAANLRPASPRQSHVTAAVSFDLGVDLYPGHLVRDHELNSGLLGGIQRIHLQKLPALYGEHAC